LRWLFSALDFAGYCHRIEVKMKALLLIDIQNDFLPGGALAVTNGDEVVSVANRLIPEYELVVATQDWHPKGHGSFASQHPDHNAGDTIDLEGLDQILWPDHCVQATVGAEFAPGLNTESIHHVIQKGTDPNIDSYSGFFDNAKRKATGLETYLRKEDVDEVHVMGLATDYCVKFTALDAVELGFRVVLRLDGIRGVELRIGDCALAIEDMVTAGVERRRERMMAIKFYSKIKAYGEFSNFSEHAIEMHGRSYPTIEHYFQAMKFSGDEQAEKIRTADNPMTAKRLGRTRKVKLRDDWKETIAHKKDVLELSHRFERVCRARWELDQ